MIQPTQLTCLLRAELEVDMMLSDRQGFALQGAKTRYLIYPILTQH